MSLVFSILGFGIIVMIHELGHYIFAKSLGVGVIEFSIGMGPRLISRVHGETRYSLRLLPFGGSCMMLGEETEEKPGSENGIVADGRLFSADRQFVNQKAWKRFLIIAAGPVFNFVLAFLLSVIVTANTGWRRPVVMAVYDNSPAQEAGIREGDTIEQLGIRGRKTTIKTADDIYLFFFANSELAQKGEPVSVMFTDREGRQKKGKMVMRYNEEEGRYLFGISYNINAEPCDSFGQLLEMSFHNIVYCFRNTIESLRMLIRGEVDQSEVKGVVGMVAVMDESVDAAYQSGLQEAVITLLDLMMLLSACIGFMNLIPLPALDGGRIFFILIEIITGKCVPKKVEAVVHTVGFIILMILMVLILFNDIWNLIQ